jgi:hydroxymethylpyrimidine/phosphomethylpyrimidine kinase
MIRYNTSFCRKKYQMLPVILTVAGSDPSGGAGIQADLLTISALGGYGASAVTAITVQNSRGLRSVQSVRPELVREQMEAILEDMPVAAVKIGMLVQTDVILAVCGVLGSLQPPHIVVDPVMAATRGGERMDEAGVQAIRTRLLPLATLLTPNIPETELLTGMEVRTVEEARHAGRRLLDAGARAVLVKGGHLPEAPGTDILVTGERSAVLPGQWQQQPHSHGTGCVLSSAIATFLALGDDLRTAVDRGRSFISGALQHGRTAGCGPGSVNPLYRLQDDDGNRLK